MTFNHEVGDMRTKNFNYFGDNYMTNDLRVPLEYNTWTSDKSERNTELIISTIYPFLKNIETTNQINNLNDRGYNSFHQLLTKNNCSNFKKSLCKMIPFILLFTTLCTFIMDEYMFKNISSEQLDLLLSDLYKYKNYYNDEKFTQVITYLKSKITKAINQEHRSSMQNSLFYNSGNEFNHSSAKKTRHKPAVSLGKHRFTGVQGDNDNMNKVHINVKEPKKSYTLSKEKPNVISQNILEKTRKHLMFQSINNKCNELQVKNKSVLETKKKDEIRYKIFPIDKTFIEKIPYSFKAKNPSVYDIFFENICIKKFPFKCINTTIEYEIYINKLKSERSNEKKVGFNKTSTIKLNDSKLIKLKFENFSTEKVIYSSEILTKDEETVKNNDYKSLNKIETVSDVSQSTVKTKIKEKKSSKKKDSSYSKNYHFPRRTKRSSSFNNCDYCSDLESNRSIYYYSRSSSRKRNHSGDRQETETHRFSKSKAYDLGIIDCWRYRNGFCRYKLNCKNLHGNQRTTGYIRSLTPILETRSKSICCDRYTRNDYKYSHR
ncbi:Zinc finger, CCCH-type domain-containing protein [Strongyloides ratti]|uniref:Zinc finger, CCCH-type domain-containing protein n=1 Tax=Strongyloides ratti TaxID=34506 RepID=A0A090LC75_STRRB|nr:Zinc finger, CCCH-type domain-containing protein [Strongyloides ratti]CEF65125.1 Zinc finger, CCCH-type domain-containing protein [Strongyloides ratti]